MYLKSRKNDLLEGKSHEAINRFIIRDLEGQRELDYIYKVEEINCQE